MSLGKHSGYPAVTRWGANMVYDLLRNLAWLVSRPWKRSVHWHAPLPEGSIMLAVNHPTSLDPFMVASLVKRRMVFLTSYKLFQLPLIGRLCKAGGMISAGMGSPRHALQAAIAALHQGYTICVFPEGRISPETGEVATLRSGAARIALGAKATIVPVGIYAPAEYLKLLPVKVNGRTDHIRWYRGGPYAVTFGKPISLDDRKNDGKSIRDLSEEIAAHIAALSAEGRARVAALV